MSEQILLKHIPSAILNIEGQCHRVKRIGKGRFTEAWKNSRSVYLITRERSWGTDYSKEIYTGVGSIHVPRITYLGMLNGQEARVYKSPFYFRLTAKNKIAWAQFKELVRLNEQAWNNHRAECDAREHDDACGSDVRQELIELVRASSLPCSIRNALVELHNRAYSYGHGYTFEFRKGNLGVTKSGTLIFIDVLFDMEAVDEYQRQRSGRVRPSWLGF